jgi:hypothetical protein
MVVKSATKKKLMDMGIPEGMAHYMANEIKYAAIKSMTWDEFYEKYANTFQSALGYGKYGEYANGKRYFIPNPYYLEFAFAIIHDLPIEPPQPASVGLINWVSLLTDYTDEQYNEAYEAFDFQAKAKRGLRERKEPYDDYRKWWEKQQEEDRRKKRYPNPYDWNTQKSRQEYDRFIRQQYLQTQNPYMQK